MPKFLGQIFKTGSPHSTTMMPANRYEGFKDTGGVVLRDRRGTAKAEIPDADFKSIGMGDNPLALYKPSTAKADNAAKAMASFNGWTYAAVNAIASEVELVRTLRLNQKLSI